MVKDVVEAVFCPVGASVQIADVATHINEQIRRQENSMKMLDIQNNLHGAPPIMAPGRWFIREERLMKVSEETSCMPERPP